VSSAVRPLVSIGVPVYNGEGFLARALTSLLDQSVTDLELIISDNASRDATQAICEDFARRDPRVRYIRQTVNIGAPRNWNVVSDAACGEFFKWASASDVVAPTMLARCIETLRAEPDTVLCYGRTQFVDADERPLQLVESDIEVLDDLPSERFRYVCMNLALNNAQSGVIRLDVLRRSGGDRLYPSGDMALMAELALYGRFRLLPDVLVFRRQTPGTFTSMLTPAQVQRIYNPQSRSPMKLIRARRHLDSLISICRAPIGAGQKLRAISIALRFAAWDRDNLWREFLSLFARAPAADS
jgi:glycosyltransferase involved in cell wall biosynthesis